MLTTNASITLAMTKTTTEQKTNSKELLADSLPDISFTACQANVCYLWKQHQTHFHKAFNLPE